MSGSGMMQGGSYQANVIAWLYVHILREQRLQWFDLRNDQPTAIAGEVDGPGDDARVDFPPGVPSIEVQAKHGLSGATRFRQALQRIVHDDSHPDRGVVIVVDRTATDWICRVLPDDLERLRQGRADAVRYQTKTLRHL